MILGLVGCGSDQTGARVSGGPLSQPSEWGATAVLLPGQDWSDAMLVLHNENGPDATLERVRLVGASRGVRIVVARARATPPSEGVAGTDTRWPPSPLKSHQLRALAGASVPAGAGSPPDYDGRQVVLRIEVPDELGRYHFDKIAVEYRTAANRYVKEFPAPRVFCVAQRTDAPCDFDPSDPTHAGPRRPDGEERRTTPP